ncbi:MAG: hypothetical protein ACRDMZ_08225, partial [Solirubrobacteraceae bacterium]
PLRLAPGQPAALLLPAASSPGLRLELRPETGEIRVASLLIPGRSVAEAMRGFGAWCLAVAVMLVGWLLLRYAAPVATPLLLALCALTVATTLPLLAFRLLPEGAATARVMLPAVALLASLLLGARTAPRRRAYAEGLALVAALVFGAWVRMVFLPSAGSWDTEYWKAWMRHAATHGVTHVYGGPEAVPPGHLLPQMRGQEPLWQLADHGRSFVVDYPPLAMAAWRASWAVTRSLGVRDFGEAENIAVKLPAVLGDMLAVALLLFLWRETPRRALTLAALYWALPLSWLSSAVLGFLDGACAPVVLAALLCAQKRRGAAAGAALALACLLKPTAIIVAPAMIVALWPERRLLGRAI